jgi:hypothetical protein
MIQIPLPAEWFIWKAVSWWNIDVWVIFKILLVLFLATKPPLWEKLCKNVGLDKNSKMLKLFWASAIFLMFGCVAIYPPFHGQALTLSGRKLEGATIFRSLATRSFHPFYLDYSGGSFQTVSSKCDDNGDFYFPATLDLKLFPYELIADSGLNLFEAHGNAFVEPLAYPEKYSNDLDKETVAVLVFSDHVSRIKWYLKRALEGNNFTVEKIAKWQMDEILGGMQNIEVQKSYEDYKAEISELLSNKIYSGRIKDVKIRKFFGLT